jgi:hypothetical protein
MIPTNAAIYVASISGVNASGEKVYGTPQAIYCSLIDKVEFLPGKNTEVLKITKTLLTETELFEEQAVWLNKSEINDRKKALTVLIKESCYSPYSDNRYFRVRLG